MIDIPALAADCERKRLAYADEMDHLAKYAQADCLQVRDGIAPDALAGTVLRRALNTWIAWREADTELRAARGY
jgi:hypothetical protein